MTNDDDMILTQSYQVKLELELELELEWSRTREFGSPTLVDDEPTSSLCEPTRSISNSLGEPTQSISPSSLLVRCSS